MLHSSVHSKDSLLKKYYNVRSSYGIMLFAIFVNGLIGLSTTGSGVMRLIIISDAAAAATLVDSRLCLYQV